MTIDPQTREVLEFDQALSLIAARAASSLGRDFIASLTPLPDRPAVESRIAIIHDLMTMLTSNQALPLGGLFDATAIFEQVRIPGTLLDEEEWPRIAAFLDLCARLAAFRGRHRQQYPCLAALLDRVIPNPDLLATLGHTLDKDGRIRDDATRELASARQALRHGEQQLLRTVNRLVGDLHRRGLLQEDFSTLRNGRHVFPVKVGARGRVGGILHGSSSSGETLYVEPAEVVEASNEVESLRERELRELHRILLDLSSKLREHLPVAFLTLDVLRELDGLHAIARTAVEKSWNIPIIQDDGALRLFNAHHPLLNLRGGRSVPITMLLDRGDRCVVLSGPNAGGKTTAMKMLGLLALLVRCGSPIPAFPDSTIPLFENVLADIGDRQDLQQGLSTFSGHIRRIGELWQQAGPRSLVLLDEVGTGTDPQEGGALALALLEGFNTRAALTITTSHLNPVKVWAEDTPGVRNASFTLDPQTHEPTFTLRLDLPGASEALEIAAKEGFPAPLLERARSLVDKRQLEMGELLRRIEERERRLVSAVKDAEARAQSLAEQERVASARAEMLRNERRELKEAALGEKERLLAGAREQVERLIAELPGEEEWRRRKEILVRARAGIVGEQAAVREEGTLLAGQRAEPAALSPGRRVYIRSLRQWGELASLDAEAGKARLRLGKMEVSAPVEDLLDFDPRERRAEQQALAEDAAEERQGQSKKRKKGRKIRTALREAEEIEPSVPTRVTYAGKSISMPARPTSMTLDLHGYRVEEALKEVDRFLDRSLLAGFPHVKICHGAGTGRLYKAIHEYLRQHPSVKTYRFATADEGGGGMTIVEL